MITDELRTWSARRLAGWKMAREEHDELAAIADRIDAEHRAALEKLAAAVDEDRDGCNVNEQKPQVSGIIVLFR